LGPSSKTEDMPDISDRWKEELTSILRPRLLDTRHDWDVRDPEFDKKFGSNCNSTSKDIKKFAKALKCTEIDELKDKGDTDDSKIFTAFFRSIVRSLWKHRTKSSTLTRMMWILDQGSVDIEIILASFVLAACVIGRGESGKPVKYDVFKKSRREAKAERYTMPDIFDTNLALEWSHVERTKMGANRDQNYHFQSILLKENLTLDEDIASSEGMSTFKESFYSGLSDLAAFGLQNGLKDQHYNRMLMVICHTSSWEIKDVLKAFFMSTCVYEKGPYEKKERKRDSGDEASEDSSVAKRSK
jgi:hypothetical protein